MKESILQKFIRLFRDIDKEILPNANVLERIYIVFDFLWEKIKYNIELIDYVQYRFYFRFLSIIFNQLRNKLLANYLRNGSNDLATVRISAFCVAMLSNNSFFCKENIFF